MLTVGITGRSGSGKSSVTSYYASLGHPVADGDQIARQITQPGSPVLPQLAAVFGADILHQDGTLNRKLLGARAFASAEDNQKLLDITHPAITDAFLLLQKQAAEKGAPLFFLDGAMIVGQPIQALCDKLIVVTCPHKLSVSRIILRDGISKVAASRRLAAQMPEETLQAAADYIIDNSGGLALLHQRAEKVLQLLLAMAQ